MPVSVKSHKVVSLKLNLPEHYLCLYDDGFKYSDKLTLLEMAINSLIINRDKSSMAYGKKGKYGKRFYNPKDQYFYVTFSIQELRDTLPLRYYGGKFIKYSANQIEFALKRLEDFGLITRIHKEHHNQIRSHIIDNYILSMPDNSADSSASNPQITDPVTQYKGNRKQGKQNSVHVKTVNTKKRDQRSLASTKSDNNNNKYKFKPMSKDDRICEMLIHSWGLSKSSAFQIMKFSVDNKQNAKVIMGLIKEARNTVAKNNHLKGDIIQFEKNKYIVDNMPTQLNRVFSLILDPKYKYKTKYSKEYVDITHYQRWFIQCMKTFFKDAFGLNKHKMVSPKGSNKSNDKKPHLSKEEQDLLSDKTPKLHPTSAKTQKKIQKQLADLDKPKNQHQTANKQTSKPNNTNESNTLADGSSVTNPFDAPNDNQSNNNDNNSDSENNNSSIFDKSDKDIELDQDKHELTQLSEFCKDYKAKVQQDSIVGFYGKQAGLNPDLCDKYDGQRVSDLEDKTSDLKFTIKMESQSNKSKVGAE